jgi:hypothetical protein
MQCSIGGWCVRVGMDGIVMICVNAKGMSSGCREEVVCGVPLLSSYVWSFSLSHVKGGPSNALSLCE